MNDFYYPGQEPGGNAPLPQNRYPADPPNGVDPNAPPQGVYLNPPSPYPAPTPPPPFQQQYLPPPPVQPPPNYSAPYYPPPPPPPGYTFYQPMDEKKGLAIASMVLGIVSLFFFCIPFLSVPLGITAVVMGAFAWKSVQCKGMAIAGIICGGIGLLLLLLGLGAEIFGSLLYNPYEYLFDW